MNSLQLMMKKMMKTENSPINKLVIWNSTNISLDRKNTNKMPFQFKAISTSDKPFIGKVAAGCGCTSVLVENITSKLNSKGKKAKLAPSNIINKDDVFLIKGFLTKRGSLGKHSKTVTFTVNSQDGKVLQTDKLNFTINVL